MSPIRGAGPFSPPGIDLILWFTGIAQVASEEGKKSESPKAWLELYRKLEFEGRPGAGAGAPEERGGGIGALDGTEEKRGRG